MIFTQMFDMVNEGIVVLDANLSVCQWNRWMAVHSRITPGDIVGKPLFSFFPNLDVPWFLRNCKSVLKFGNFAFFSQKLHRYCFPLTPSSPGASGFEYMQQSCTMGPLRDTAGRITHLFITVQDVSEVAAYEKRLREMNIRDGLTGVYNRQYFQARLEEEVERHQRYKRPLSLILQDIDFFKSVNDTYGHPCGDHILSEFAALNQGAVRDVDLFARYGGEEFCCLMPETDIDDAVKTAERLKSIVADTFFSYAGADIRITMSQGVAGLCPDENSVESLLTAADQALYSAKNAGRNRVVINTRATHPQALPTPDKATNPGI